MPQATQVGLCWDDLYLHVQFNAMDDKLLKNTYSQCNQETWNQEVVELFAVCEEDGSSSDGLITHYTEIELTPHDVLYVADITNPYGNGTDKSNKMVPCDESGIVHKASLGTSGFVASFAVPWSTITCGSTGRKDSYRGNLFRVVMDQDVDTCTPETCTFGCWSPTDTDPPQFHVTPVFGRFVLA